VKRTSTKAGTAMAGAAFLAAVALVLTGGPTTLSPVWAQDAPAASADKEAAEAKAREVKRDELIARFEAGKTQYGRGELDKAEETFKKIQAELKATGIDIDSLFVSRDPAKWLDRIKARREELIKEKSEADRKALADKARAKDEKEREDREAKADEERKAREDKRDQLVALFNTGKDQ